MKTLRLGTLLFVLAVGPLCAQEEIVLPEATPTKQDVNQLHIPSGLELQCLPILDEDTSILGVYVFYVNTSLNDYLLVAPGLFSLGFLVDVGEVNEEGEGEMGLYETTFSVTTHEPKKKPAVFSVRAGQICGERILFDEEARKKLNTMSTIEVFSTTYRTFILTKENGVYQYTPVKTTLRRRMKVTRKGDDLAESVIYQEPFMIDNTEGVAADFVQKKEDAEEARKEILKLVKEKRMHVPGTDTTSHPRSVENTAP